MRDIPTTRSGASLAARNRLVVALLVCCSAGCDKTVGLPSTPGDATDASPQVTPTVSLEKDAGVMRPGEKRIVDFEVVNPTQSQWTLRDLSTSCGCTQAFPDSETIAPKSSTKFHVRYLAGGRTRHERRVVFLRFREQCAPEVALGLGVTILEPMTVTPEDLFLDAAPDSEYRHQFNVLNYSGAPWDGVNASTTAKWMRAAVSRSIPISELAAAAPPRQEWGVRLVVSTAGLSPGDYTGYLNLHEATWQQSVRVSIAVRGAVAVIPSALFFGEVGVGKPVEREVLIRFAQPRDPELRLRVTPSAGIANQVRLLLGDDGSQYVRLSAVLTANGPGPVGGDVRLSVGGGQQHFPDISVPVVADAQSPDGGGK